MPKLRWDQYLTIVLILLLSLITSVQSAQQLTLPSIHQQPITLLEPGLLAVQTATASAQANLFADFTASVSAQAVYVIDLPTAAVLLSKNNQQLLYPASTTKMITALVARETYALDQVLTVESEASTEGNGMGLQLQEKISVANLLTGLLVNSGNDAAYTLANHHPQGYEGFIKAMNQKAQDLHLDQSHFKNPSGFDHPEQLTTAHDLAILAQALMQDEFLRNLVATPKIAVTDITGKINHYLVNTNSLLTSEAGVVGIKTGTTELAGEVLITQLETNAQQLLIVVMNSQHRYADTKKIINWIFANYYWVDYNRAIAQQQ
ncbi:MAG: hypothetical protein GF390_02340 [Candidatus Pacebacteria bacterium]|nr:hypothetical protein [Candidatus Paceibacterota bacterium]